MTMIALRWMGCALCLILCASAARAQGSVAQFADLNTGPNSQAQGSMGAASVFFDNRTFFVATTAESGTELWVTDGSAVNTRLFADLCPGRCSGSPQSFHIEAGDLYFTADDGMRGLELWRLSPGGGAPTFLIDINPGPSSSLPARFERISFRANGTLVTRTFFAATRAGEGRELWRLNAGTTPTVALERDIVPGPSSSEPRGMEVLNTLQVGLTVATSPGMREVVALDYASATAPPTGVTVFTAFGTNAQRRANDELRTLGSNTYLVVRDINTLDDELWVFQGTNASAIKLRTADVIGSITFNVALFRTFFTARSGSARQLMVSDGSLAGTVTLGAASLDADNLASLGNRVLFTGVTAAAGRELFITDGTAANTVLLKELVSGSAGISGALHVIAASGARYLLAFADQLWISDGTSAGTIEISGSAISGDGAIVTLTPTTGVESLIGFAAGAAFGGEPFYSRGTAATTVALGNLRGDVGDSLPRPFGVYGQRVVFSAFVPGQSVSVKSLPVSGGGPLEALGSFIEVDSGQHFGRFWFRGTNGLVMTDGTAAGTSINPAVRPEIRGPECVFERNGAAYFIGAPPSSSSDVEIFRSDGTEAGTVAVTDVSNGSDRGILDACSRSIHQIAGLDNRLLFAATTPATGTELHVLDGNDDVSLVVDLRAGPNGANMIDLVALGDRVVFDADDGIFGVELWSSTGTAQGTLRLTDTNPGVGNGNPRDLTRVGDRVFFTASDPTSGRELYVTDGTVAGTRRVVDLFAGTGSAFGDYDAQFTVTNGKLFFRAGSSSQPGCVLFESDGSAAGTRCAYDPASTALGPVQEIEATASGALVFSAWRATDGEEPRVLFNGTLLGLAGGDVAPGPSGSAPQLLRAAGNDVYFQADDGVTGAELWRLSLGDLDLLYRDGFE
jgi:ELWxxDGT repeat protein